MLHYNPEEHFLRYCRTPLQTAIDGGRRRVAESCDEAREDGREEGGRIADAPHVRVLEARGGHGQLLALAPAV